MVCKSKVLICVSATVVAVWSMVYSFATLSAHSNSLPDALLLPACHSRALACEQPLDPQDPDEMVGMLDGHCRDGLGAAIFCQESNLFPYLDMYAIQGQDGEAASFVLSSREAVYDQACQDGLAGPFPCDDVDLLAFLPLDEMGGGRGSDIWGWTDPKTGREYAIMGRNNGTSFVDITTPISPTYLGNLPTADKTAPWRDLKVYKDRAFIVADYGGVHGMQIFDLNQLALNQLALNQSREISSTHSTTATLPLSSTIITTPTVTTPTVFTSAARYADFNRAHNIVINEDSGYAYTVGGETCSFGPHIIDIQNPLDPQFVGCYGDDEYTHDSQCVYYHGPDLAYNDREICFNSNEDTLTIVDMTDKQNPQMLSRIDSSGFDFDFGYFHQSWLTEDHHYLLSNDELDEIRFEHNARTHIWDVSDLHNPTVIGLYTADVRSVDHNLYVRGNYLFEANYTSGLRIFTLDDIANGELTEVAYLDTLPELDDRATKGAWSVYPYFESGAVIVSSIEDGLFVLRPNLPPEYAVNTNDNVLDYCLDTSTVMTDSMVTFSDALHLAAYNNYSGTLQLSVESSNPAIVLSNDLAQFGGNGEAEVDIQIDPTSFAEGVHEFDVTITDGVSASSLRYEFQLHSTIPKAVVIDAESGTTTIPGAFSWPSAVGAVDYVVEVSDTIDFSNVLYTERTRSTGIPNPSLLTQGETYFWRVRAFNACGYSIGAGKEQMLQIGEFTYLPLIQ